MKDTTKKTYSFSDNGFVQVIKGNLGILIGLVIMCVGLTVSLDSFAT